jgi:hypothetical protein
VKRFVPEVKKLLAKRLSFGDNVSTQDNISTATITDRKRHIVMLRLTVMTISVKLIIPPAPIPCKLLPTSIIVKFFANPATIAPKVKKVRATKMSGLRPNICEKLAKLGWKTVEVLRQRVL